MGPPWVFLSLPTSPEEPAKLDANSGCGRYPFLPDTQVVPFPACWSHPGFSPSLSASSSRCSTDLGTDRRAGVFCSGTVSHCLLLSGLPDEHYHCHSHGNNTSTQRPPRSRAPSHVCSHRAPFHQCGGESPFHRAKAGEQPSPRRQGNVSFTQPECFVLGTDSPQGENIPGFQRQLHRVLRALPKDDPALSLPYPEEPFHRPPLSVPDRSIQ